MVDLIHAYLAHLGAGTYSKFTIDERRMLLLRLDRELPFGVADVSTEELEEWLLTVPRGSGPSWTVRTYFYALRSFYGWAARTRRLDWDPTADMEPPRPPEAEPHPATEQQLALALTLPAPWRTAVVLAAFNGLRCGEIARLNRQHITADALWILRKGGRRQALPIHREVWAAVEHLPSGPVVRSRLGRGYRDRPKQLSSAISKRLTALGMPDLTLHRFRHRFATIALLPRELGGAGADIRTVQELLGHRSVSSTQIYTAVTDRQRRLAIDALPVPASPQQDAA